MSITPETITEIKQQRLTNGHYSMLPLTITLGAGQTRYEDYTIPAYTNGLDWMNAHFSCNDSDSGDEIVCGKMLGGQIGVLASEAVPVSNIEEDAMVVNVTAPSGVMRSTVDGGVIDEGFYLSFGNDTATATSINAGPPSGNLLNPDQELKEYEIKRIGAETVIGGGYSTTPITLFTNLSGTIAANTPVNLIVRCIKWILPVTKGDNIDIGGDILLAGNIPPGKKIRFGYKDCRSSGADKIVRARMTVLY